MNVSRTPALAGEVSRVLLDAGYDVRADCVASCEEAYAASASAPPDVVVIHHDPSPAGRAVVLKALRELGALVPCIIVGNEINAEAVEFMRAGARDFILKDQLPGIGAAVAAVLQTPHERVIERRTEKALRESEWKFSSMIRISPDPIALSRLADGRYIDVNDAFTRILGYTKDEIYGRSPLPGDLNVWTNQEDRARFTSELKAKGEITGFEAPFRAKDGHIFTGLVSAGIVEIDGESCIVTFTRDISKRKQAEVEREAALRLLRLCNQHDDVKALIHALTLFFQELSGCESIGVRLHDGPDFPYFETNGFSKEFVMAETRLCAHDAAGGLLRDEMGNPKLDCMCGKIISGQFDSTKPFFTKNGSFWTNSTTELLASTTEADRQARTRDRCNRAGYESVALIPLRHQGSTLGLLQFNDQRKDMFTADSIALIEGLADYTTVALLKLESDRALRSSEEHLRVILDTAEAGYFFIDPDGLFQRVNAAWLRLHGYERAEEILGKHFSHTQPADDLEKAAEIVAQLLAGVKIEAGEFSRRLKNGSIGYHSFSAHPVREKGRIVGIEGFLIDTTGLRKIRNEYQMLFDRMLDGFALHEMVFDAEGNPADYQFLAINPAFEKMTGLRAADVIGKNVLTVLPETERRWMELYGDVVRTGVAKRFDDFSQALGKHFEVLAFRPQQNQFACLIQDVTTRKELELQLIQSQKIEAIGQLAGGIAHDFNNILAAIMMHLGLLLRQPGLMRDMKESLRELEAEAKRAANLTRQLLLFSRRQSMHFCATDLNDLLSNLLKMLRRLITEHVKLVFASGREPLWIEADPGMIEQVVVNLCVNARDAMPNGGELKIEAYAATLSATEILGDSQSRAGNFICLTVTDHGIGMDAETLKHIYEPFFTTKEAGKGTGLGLTTVYSIVKQHKGWINVHSTPDKGTTFRIFLPAGNAPVPSVAKADQLPITGGSEGVLVVEDDVSFRSMLTMSLKVLGYRVFEADNGKNAMIVWAGHSAEIGMLLADLVMPGGTSGIELCHRLALEKPDLRMIVTTGYSAERLDLTELASEGISFLPKPFSAATLAAVVRHSFDHAAPDATSARPPQP